MRRRHVDDTQLADLPRPEDDGAADHLPGMLLPSLPMRSTTGADVDLGSIPGRTVVFCYPMTGTPGIRMPAGWDLIPGARGCTPQACSLRDRYREFEALEVELYGVSTQETAARQEAVARLHPPYQLLSDVGLRFARALGLPSFEAEGKQRLKRLTLILTDGMVQHVIYPVFPPHDHADQVIGWLIAR